MVSSHTHTQRPQQPTSTQSSRLSAKKGVWTDHIEGRFCKITVHQLAMAWWCYNEGHITRMQLRIFFAACEMAERRRYTDPHNGPQRPLYGLEEIKALVGGRGTKTADASLRADVKRLARLGLVTITDHAIDFAVSIDQLRLDDISAFWTMFNQLPHPRRAVPVPRRVLRAMAGGFTSGMTAVAVAVMIRSLFWHRDAGENRGSRGEKQSGTPGRGGGGGAYRVDGRTKREWIAQVFGVSLRTVTDGRARLIELGWLEPLDAPQHMLNRYGTHDQINTNWKPCPNKDNDSTVARNGEESARTSGSSGGGGCAGTHAHPTHTAKETQSAPGRSASPNTRFSGKSASPDLNRSLPLTGNQNTRKPAPTRAGPSGASLRSALGSRGKKREGEHRARRSRRDVPTIRNITSDDLKDMGRLLQLHEQAVGLGLANCTEHGRLEFLSLAERARTSGKRAGALFFWLLREKKTEFITQSAEDEASRRLKEHLYGNTTKRKMETGWKEQETQDVQGDQSTNPTANTAKEQWGGDVRGGEGNRTIRQLAVEPTVDVRFLWACQRVGQQTRHEPFQIARAKGWTQDRWDAALEASCQMQNARHTQAMEKETLVEWA